MVLILSLTVHFSFQWPFVRYFGVQEPASVLFSLFNLFSCLYMFIKFYRNLTEPESLRIIWLAYSMVMTTENLSKVVSFGHFILFS